MSAAIITSPLFVRYHGENLWPGSTGQDGSAIKRNPSCKLATLPVTDVQEADTMYFRLASDEALWTHRKQECREAIGKLKDPKSLANMPMFAGFFWGS